MGARENYLRQAEELIEDKVGEITRRSSIYETSAWGNEDQPAFLNSVIKIETNLNPKKLLHQILLIEEQIGRTRSNEKWQQRIIDIDILFINDDVINLPELKVPHPFLQKRMFTLIPLSEIAEDIIHPVLKKSIKQLLNECTDKLEVKKYAL